MKILNLQKSLWVSTNQIMSETENVKKRPKIEECPISIDSDEGTEKRSFNILENALTYGKNKTKKFFEKYSAQRIH